MICDLQSRDSTLSTLHLSSSAPQLLVPDSGVGMGPGVCSAGCRRPGTRSSEPTTGTFPLLKGGFHKYCEILYFKISLTPLHYLRVDQALCVWSEPGNERNCSPRSSLQVSAPCCCCTRVRGLDWEMRLLTVSSCSGQSLVSPGVDQPRPRPAP